MMIAKVILYKHFLFYIIFIKVGEESHIENFVEDNQISKEIVFLQGLNIIIQLLETPLWGSLKYPKK
jgi:hypothetical protein